VWLEAGMGSVWVAVGRVVRRIRRKTTKWQRW
jgi:hypothetical protein